MVQIVIAALAKGMATANLTFEESLTLLNAKFVENGYAPAAHCSYGVNVSAGKWLPCFQFREYATRTGCDTEDGV